MLAIAFPTINPDIVAIGPLVIRWYSMAYIVGAVAGLFYIKYLLKNIVFIENPKRKKQFFDDLLSFNVLGVIIGGRLGYVLFYNPLYFAQNPIEILYLWQGGMSFHGGLLGVILASYLLSKKYKKSLTQITDILAPAIPIGLFLGRIANFINAELYGKVTTLPWGVVFPNEILPRHPSQLYEAFLEGLVLFIIISFLWHKKYYKYKGRLSGYLLTFYAIFRGAVEFVRIADYTILGITAGQLLSIPMLLIGIYLIKKSYNVYPTTKKSN